MAKKRKPAADAGSLTAPGASDGRWLLAGAGHDLPVEQIRPSPFQPRREFDQAELRQLADTMLSTGLLQPIVVRPIDEGDEQPFELVAGERRLRAAKLAGLAAVPAIVLNLDDREAETATAVENLQRRDLNPIEEARAYRALLDAEPGLTQEELGRRLGKSQPHVANRLRLMKLPQAMQKLIISGEIPPSFARELARWPDHPAVRDAIDLEVAELLKYDEIGGWFAGFRDRLEDAVHDATRPLAGDSYVPAVGRRVKIPEFTPEERDRLAVVEIPRITRLDGAGTKTEQRATNAALWDELVKERCAKAESGERRAESKQQKGQAAKPLTAAQKKAAAEEDKRRARERAAQFRRRLWNWYVNWYRYLIAGWIRREADLADICRILLLVDVQWVRGYECLRGDCLSEIIKAEGLGGPKRSGYKPPDFIAALWRLPAESVEEVARKFVAAVFCDLETGEPNEHIVRAADVGVLAKQVGVDAESAWLLEQAGPLSEAYWNLHDKEQLTALGKELKVELQAGWKKADMVKAFLACRPKPDDKEVGINLPAELKKIKEPKEPKG